MNQMLNRFFSRSLNHRGTLRALPLMLLCLVLAAAPVVADTKTWDADNGTGEWNEDNSWYPDAEPTPQDDAVINASGAVVTASQTFKAKSVTIGGHQVSTLQTNDFVSGTIDPGQTTDTAVLNRRDGHLVLKGDAGTVHVKGTYKDSEESMAQKPSLVFYVK